MVRHAAVAVEKRKAEGVRRKLIDMNILRKDLKIKRDDRFVYFPVLAIPEIDEAKYVGEIEFEESKNKSYIELLQEEGIELDSVSIDFIGDIAVIRCDERISTKLAEILIKAHNSTKAVYLDRGVRDEYRIRDLKFLSGRKETETVHVENGVRLKLDISKVYFSPRLAGERMRVARKVGEGERIIDMFTGVAPFPLVIAKHANPSKIYGIDINPYAIKYAIHNVKINGFDSIIEIIQGDAGEVVKSLPYADRVIMNLPHKSKEFLDIAVEKGKIIHYYEILERNKIEERKRQIEKWYGVEITESRIVGSYSPSKQKVVFDITV